MKIVAIGNNILRNTLGTAIVAGALLAATPNKTDAQAQDSFEQVYEIPPKGTSDFMKLLWAPSPKVKINDIDYKAKIVIDLSENVLYKYNEKGRATHAYLVASGAKSTPSTPGIKIVTHVEKYPYKSAPPSTKRYKRPNDYGPCIICLETVNPETGKRGITGEFIHGNNNPSSIGKYASKGCIRMDNEVIKELAREVKRGDLVLVIND